MLVAQLLAADTADSLYSLPLASIALARSFIDGAFFYFEAARDHRFYVRAQRNTYQVLVRSPNSTTQ